MKLKGAYGKCTLCRMSSNTVVYLGKGTYIHLWCIDLWDEMGKANKYRYLAKRFDKNCANK